MPNLLFSTRLAGHRYNSDALPCYTVTISTRLTKLIWEQAAPLCCKLPIGYNQATHIRPHDKPSCGPLPKLSGPIQPTIPNCIHSWSAILSSALWCTWQTHRGQQMAGGNVQWLWPAFALQTATSDLITKIKPTTTVSWLYTGQLVLARTAVTNKRTLLQ